MALRLCVAWIVTAALLLWEAALFIGSPSDTRTAVLGLFFVGIPYIVLMTRWVVTGRFRR